MNRFKVLYYPNSDCSPLTLAKSILVFDEITFFDHPSLSMKKVGTVGHDSRMRQIKPILEKEGYAINVIKPWSGRVENEIQCIIDSDLTNQSFRGTFMKLVKNDPSFLMSKVPNGNYGKYGDAENYRRLILSTKEDEIPLTIGETNNLESEDGISPELNVAMSMVADSYKFNLSSYLAIENDLQLFGDSVGMSMLLNAKLRKASDKDARNESISHEVAFTLLDNLVPNEAFRGKKIIDIVRFRNKTEKERNRFKERILEATANFNELLDKDKEKVIDSIVYKQLLPEARDYQKKMAQNWDSFFKESTKSVVTSVHPISQVIVTMLSRSLAAALLAGALEIGIKVMPNLIDYLKEKEALKRENPFNYLMKF